MAPATGAADQVSPNRFASSIARYRGGEWRAPIMRDLIAEDVQAAGRDCTILDIGCGKGFDDDVGLQRSLASLAQEFVGIEPDPAVELGDHFTRVHRGVLEDAALPAQSVDVAFAVMVLEHLEQPKLFFDKLHDCLKPGGVFWGFTVDGRSFFRLASEWTDRLHVKELYMRFMMGRRGEDRYLNYPVYYRANRPRDLAQCTGRFRSCEVVSLSREGQHRVAVPRSLQPLADRYDRWVVASGRPGTLLAVRVVK